MSNTFKPTHIPYEDGIARIKEALSKAGHKMDSGVLTSRDKVAVKLTNLLTAGEGLPQGFAKWQLPFYLSGGQFFVTVAQPGANAGDHSHDEDGVRFIMSGSIYYDGIELNSGDWMFIPKGKNYGFKVGPFGAAMCYCYACCCVPRGLTNSDLIDPAPYVRERKSLSR